MGEKLAEISELVYHLYKNNYTKHLLETIDSYTPLDKRNASYELSRYNKLYIELDKKWNTLCEDYKQSDELLSLHNKFMNELPTSVLFTKMPLLEASIRIINFYKNTLVDKCVALLQGYLLSMDDQYFMESPYGEEIRSITKSVVISYNDLKKEYNDFNDLFFINIELW